MYNDPSGQTTPNIITESIKAFGDVPVDFDTLIELSTTYTYTHFAIINSLDNDVVIKFGTNEITFQYGKDIIFDNFKFNGTIEYKYKSSEPTSGSIQIICY